MNVFILEDSVNRNQCFSDILLKDGIYFTICDNVARAKIEWPERHWDLALLDHDLEDAHYQGKNIDNDNTGTVFARWVANRALNEGEGADEWIIHSYNPDGAERMRAALNRQYYNITVLPFGIKLLKRLESTVNDYLSLQKSLRAANSKA